MGMGIWMAGIVIVSAEVRHRRRRRRESFCHGRMIRLDSDAVYPVQHPNL
jgi:hypothetical protein